jgi:hypothetical protein
MKRSLLDVPDGLLLANSGPFGGPQRLLLFRQKLTFRRRYPLLRELLLLLPREPTSRAAVANTAFDPNRTSYGETDRHSPNIVYGLN